MVYGVMRKRKFTIARVALWLVYSIVSNNQITNTHTYYLTVIRRRGLLGARWSTAEHCVYDTIG